MTLIEARLYLTWDFYTRIRLSPFHHQSVLKILWSPTSKNPNSSHFMTSSMFTQLWPQHPHLKSYLSNNLQTKLSQFQLLNLSKNKNFTFHSSSPIYSLSKMSKSQFRLRNLQYNQSKSNRHQQKLLNHPRRRSLRNNSRKRLMSSIPSWIEYSRSWHSDWVERSSSLLKWILKMINLSPSKLGLKSLQNSSIREQTNSWKSSKMQMTRAELHLKPRDSKNSELDWLTSFISLINKYL